MIADPQKTYAADPLELRVTDPLEISFACQCDPLEIPFACQCDPLEIRLIKVALRQAVARNSPPDCCI